MSTIDQGLPGDFVDVVEHPCLGGQSGLNFVVVVTIAVVVVAVVPGEVVVAIG